VKPLVEGPRPSDADAVTLRRADPAAVDRLALVLARAFYEDPVFGWLIPSERRRHAGLRRFFEIELRTLGFSRGSTWTTVDLAGAAIALPPGRWRFPTAALLRHGAGFARVFGIDLARAALYLQVIERRHLREPHHYLAYIGVAPEFQGQGLGSRLLGPTLERCDAERVPAYLEASTERNARLYERHGFVVSSELVFRGSPPLRLMVRPTQPRAY
jgi:ribosomal protein S18 acetylase RimI-like enzyme